jgi:Flp pilus assembly protein protease CpaA
VYLVLFIFFLLFSLIATIQDLQSGQVSRVLLWGGIAVMLLIQAFQAWTLFLPALGGTALGLGMFLLVWFLSGKKLGLADVWYAGLLGAALGPLWLYPAIGAACLFAFACFLISRNKSIPFIPSMALAGLATFIAKIFL